jgi:hypothetical protein
MEPRFDSSFKKLFVMSTYPSSSSIKLSGMPAVKTFLKGGFHNDPPLNIRNSSILQSSLLSP